MIGRRRSPTGNPDPVAFLERLGRSRIGDDYTEADRYRDFRRLFLDTQRGRRVLWQIFEMGNLFAPIAVTPTPPTTATARATWHSTSWRS